MPLHNSLHFTEHGAGQGAWGVILTTSRAAGGCFHAMSVELVGLL